MPTQTTGGPMTPAQFIAKWSPVTLTESAASQEHFIDLCRLLGQPTPAEHDATGAEYTFQKGVVVGGPASKGSKGEYGWADVWWRAKFAWEYKRKDKYKDLAEAYRQLCQYREALENPPLLIVSDIARTEIHTNFTGTAKRLHVILLQDMDKPESLDLLRRVFTQPGSFEPRLTAEVITKEAAAAIGEIARSLRDRGHDPHAAAHFLMKCMFCMFAEDVGLLPSKMFSRLMEKYTREPEHLTGFLTDLFARMRTGGAFGLDDVPYFNGGLFDEGPALQLTREEAATLLAAARQDWAAVEPAIFGTLFERSLDPAKRAQIGAHYTGRDDIMLIVEPVVLEPLRRRWQETRDEVQRQIDRRTKATTDDTKRKANDAIQKTLAGFLHELSNVRILDPACGSGNFLYVAIQQLLYLEKEVIRFAVGPEVRVGLLPTVRPTQLHGIEINPYAAELAQVVIWIGYLQWMHDNGFNAPSDPILEPLQTIENRDAILDLNDPANPKPAAWPEADFIIGNPPFLGSKLFRESGLTEDYVQAMFKAFDLPKNADLCCYWFELARRAIAGDFKTRAGLLATQGIRGGDNRKVLERVKETGDIFMAWSDKDWVLDGANVHVSIVGFARNKSEETFLDGVNVPSITANLRGDMDLTKTAQLASNLSLAFMGTTKGGKFEVEWPDARRLLGAPNPNARSNFEVVRPWVNGIDLTQRAQSLWIVDFGCDRTETDAAGYEAPFQLIKNLVYPERSGIRQAAEAEIWWLHNRSRGEMRKAIDGLPRFIVTTRVAKHRLFRWYVKPTLPDSATFVFARSDDYFFGVLHSAIHELWALRMGTQLEDRPRYTPTTCFETFPLPWAPGKEPTGEEICARIAVAAKELNEQRERWLNPPEWIEPIARAVDAADNFADVPEPARALIRVSAIQAAAAKDPNLKKRTLTNLYNERPTWLKLAHRKLDEAVLAAYASVDPEGGWSEDWAEVWLDTGAGHPLPESHALLARRAEVDQAVLAALLRLNMARSQER
jgi:hypothetical protein